MLPQTDIRTLRDLIDHAAETHPDAPFLISPETGLTLTFMQLREEVRHLCARFHEMGLKLGDKVAFLMDNGLFTVQLFLGTMYGGFVAVPLNVRAGPSQLSKSLENSDAKLVFVSQQYDSLIKGVLGLVGSPVEVVPADSDAGPIGSHIPPVTGPLLLLDPNDPAMLIYTSGSTGQPKGPIHTHRSILAHGKNSTQAHQLTAADRSLLVLPLYHINAECVTLVPTLMSGGSVVIPRGFSVSAFWNWLKDYRCTWSAVVPTIISQLLELNNPAVARDVRKLEYVRFLRSSSGPLSPSLHQEFIDTFGLPLIQAMGSSEAGNVFANPVPPGRNKIGTPGLPWGFEAKIVDRDGAELPIGEPGEVLLRGEGMMQGYYKDEAGSAAALDAEGWLHTGDLAYKDEDGYFFVIGRSKELIIKGGVNIAPRQIDEIIETHPAVLEAAAVGVPDRYVGEDVVAFAVLRTGMVCSEGDLLSFCEKPLGYFKTPTRIYIVSDLPKGPSGKVQRLRLVEEAERLAATDWKKPNDGSAISGVAGDRSEPGLPTSGLPLEQMIIRIWIEILEQPNIDADSNFFALGGQSLQAIQCLFHLREATSVLLSLSDFFRNPTVAQLAALVAFRAEGVSRKESSRSDEGNSQSPPISPRDRSQPCPLSPAQERIWFMNQLITEEPAYNEAEAVRLKGKLDLDALEFAFNVVIERHEILRTTIDARDGRPKTTVHESWPLQFKRMSLRHMDANEREHALSELLISEPRLPYRLDVEPSVRVTIVQLDEDEHAFILMMHHLICDSASLGILWRELATSYEASLRGRPSPLRPLPIQYGDYAVRQRQPAQQERFAEDITFWLEKLRGAPALLDQPTDRIRPVALSFRGNKRNFTFDSELADGLRRLCREQRVSLFTVFAAALNSVMHRYTGQNDILVGIPIADRELPELRPLIGFLLDTHVLRTNLSTNPKFCELLVDVQQNVADVYSHRAIPFDQVVSALKPERNQSYSPIVQVMLNWRDRDDQPQFIGLPGVVTEGLLAHARTSKFDLTLTLTDTGTVILLEAEYSTDLFDDDRIERLAGHLRTLLKGVVADPEQRVSELPMLTDAERQCLLVEWNATAADYPRDSCIHELFEAQVAQAPEATAAVFESQSLTYAELNTRADRLAQTLRALDVGPNVLVALFLERSLDMVVGMLAVLKAGGAYIPLDPFHPRDRLADMLEDAKPLILLTQDHLRSELPPNCARLVLIDGDAPVVAAPAIGRKPSPSDLAYVIYTSGSTGTPKGVEVRHGGVVNMLDSMAKRPGLGAADRMLAITTLTFDIAVLEIFLPLVRGACVVIAPSRTTRDSAALIDLIEQADVSIMQATPATLRMLLDAGWSGSPDLKILCGGEAWTVELARPLLECCGSLWNMYGPTETTVWSAVAQVEAGKQPVIGAPVANTFLYVLDDASQLVPLGVAGELYIGGDGLARGYLRRPELNQDRFVADPFAAEPGARMYRTGDRVRRLPDGSIEMLGRLDHQVKVRGFRIELGEIEATLAKHAAVRQAVVVAREQPDGKRLVAYVVAKEDNQLASILRAHLEAKLPDYMVPAAFVRLDAFPLTPNGKIDRKALPSPGDEAYGRETYEAPRGEIEVVLAAIWAEQLGIERIGRNDDFFNLGGHSLLAIRVIGQINKTLKRHLNVFAFFLNPTIERLARVLENNEHARSETRVVPLRQGGHGLPVYLMGARPADFRIAQLIGENRSIFAIDQRIPTGWLSAGTDARRGRQPTIEQIGALYGNVLFSHVGTSPCVIAGYSLGGKIAFEAARELQRAGGNVAYVLLIDASPLTFIGPNLGPILRSLSTIFHETFNGTGNEGSYLHRLSTTLSNSWCVVKWTAPRMRGMLTAAFDLATGRLRLKRSQPPSAPEGYFDEEGMPVDKSEFYRLAHAAGRLWRPRPLDAAGVLIRASNAADILPGSDLTNGWDRLFVQGLEVVETTGDHSTMIAEENAATLAKQMNAMLERYDRISGMPAERLRNKTGTGFETRQLKLDQAPLSSDAIV
jgi:amino acid adenylation domain-containing protein